MSKPSESGKGHLSSLLWLLFVAGLGYAGYHVGMVYYHRGNLADKIEELARADRVATESQLMEQLMKTVEEQGLQGYIGPNSCKIKTMENTRQITCSYEQKTNILPGFPHLFHFDLKAEGRMF